MSDRLCKQLEISAAALGLIAGLVGLFGAFVLLPSRMEAAEKQIKILTDRDATNREMLVRIEERQINHGRLLEEMRARKQ